MEQNTGAKRPSPNRLARTSLFLGIFAIFSWFYPPVQIILGASAALSAWFSRKEHHFTGARIAGFVIGIFCILLSFFIFFQYMLVYEVARDPANADLIRQVYQQAQELLNRMGTTAQYAVSNRISGKMPDSIKGCCLAFSILS